MAENEAVPEGQQEGQQQEQQSTYDLDTAYDVIARAEGWDPRLARLQVQELKERKESLDRREREIEMQRANIAREVPQQQRPDFGGDPVAQLAYEAREEAKQTRQMFLEDRQERQKDREREQLVQTLTRELDSSFKTAARQSGMSREQIDQNADRFYEMLTGIYPEPEMIRKIGPDQAVRNAFLAFRPGAAPTVGYQTTTRVTPRTPVITSQGSGPIEDRADTGPQRQGESNTDYAQRVLRNFESLGLKGMSLRDGDKISSE